MKRVAKIVLVNVFTFLVLLIIVNQICGAILTSNDTKSRHLLPNYVSDQAHAEKVFKDYNNIQHKYQPFVGWRTLPYKGTTTTIDTDGNRLHKENTGLGDAAKKVRFFGGSTLWGEGSDDENTIPALFYHSNEASRVFNHGQLAYNSRQNLDALISLYNSGQKSDVVIFYDGVNDAAFLCPSEIQVPGHRLVPQFHEKLYATKRTIVFQILDKIFTEKIILLINRSKESDSSNLYNCLSDPGKAMEIVDFMISNWVIAHNLVEDNGGKFFAVLQPISYVGSPRLDHLELDHELGENIKMVYRLFQEKISNSGYDWIIDLTSSFDSNEYIYIDFCHVSPNGNKIISDEIDKFLSDRLQPQFLE